MLDDTIRLWNPWWGPGDPGLGDIGICREVTGTTLDPPELQHVRDIIGVRRCGKTTLLHQIISMLLERGARPSDILFLNFDDPVLASAGFEAVMVAAERVNPDARYLFIDEVQMLKGWEAWVRGYYDRKRFERIFVTGSSSSLLSRDMGTKLTGRHLTVQLLPFSFREFLMSDGWNDMRAEHLLAERGRLAHMAERYLMEGGFPQAVGKDPHVRKVLHSNLFNDILDRDVVARFDSRRKPLGELAHYLVSNVGKEFSYRRVADAIGVHVDTAKAYIEHLTEAGLLFLVDVHSHKLRVRYKANKKVYAVDTGLAASISERGFERGRLMENAVMLELVRRGSEVFYWKGAGNMEVDFVVGGMGSGGWSPVQVCADLEGKKECGREVDALLECMKYLKSTKGTVVTGSFKDIRKMDEGTIEFVPLWKFLLGLR